MKKVSKVILATTILVYSFSFDSKVMGKDFSGQEEYYKSYCSSPRANAEEAQLCRDFKTYMQNKSNELDNEIAGLNNSLTSIQGQIDIIQTELRKYQDIITQLDLDIATNITEIEQIEGHVKVLDEDIEVTMQDIETRDKLIKERMVTGQSEIGMNTYIEFLMGAKDLLDFIKISDGYERITENDQLEIEKLNNDKKKLELQKGEQQRLKEDVESKKDENIKSKNLQEEAKKGQEFLLAEFQKQEADLLQKKRSQQSIADAVQSAIISINTNIAGSVPEITPSNGWLRPVSSGYTANTFFYPFGGFHSGADFGASLHTPINAPMSGIILYSSNPYGTSSGWAGSLDGWPYGAGNSIHMVGQVDGTTYGLTFFHMAKENWITKPGQTITQGQVIGYSGNSGNSSGEHLHFEVINLGSMSMASAISRFQSTLDFAWGTGWNTTSTACKYNGYSTPCREQPERFF